MRALGALGCRSRRHREGGLFADADETGGEKHRRFVQEFSETCPPDEILRHQRPGSELGIQYRQGNDDAAAGFLHRRPPQGEGHWMDIRTAMV